MEGYGRKGGGVMRRWRVGNGEVGTEVSFTVPRGREEWKRGREGGTEGRMLIRKEMKLITE